MKLSKASIKERVSNKFCFAVLVKFSLMFSTSLFFEQLRDNFNLILSQFQPKISGISKIWLMNLICSARYYFMWLPQLIHTLYQSPFVILHSLAFWFGYFKNGPNHSIFPQISLLMTNIYSLDACSSLFLLIMLCSWFRRRQFRPVEFERRWVSWTVYRKETVKETEYDLK